METVAESIETNLKLNPKLRGDQKSPLIPSLLDYLTAWGNNYRESVEDIALFNTKPNLSWSAQQNNFFAKYFIMPEGT